MRFPKSPAQMNLVGSFKRCTKSGIRIGQSYTNKLIYLSTIGESRFLRRDIPPVMRFLKSPAQMNLRIT